MEEVVFVYSKTSSPRLEYVLHVLFHHIWEKDYLLCHDEDEFRKLQGPKITYHYHSLPSSSSLYIPASGFLDHTVAWQGSPALGWKEDLPLLFPTKEAAAIPFDIFSSIFFMLSRWEEYPEGPRDALGRFAGKSSMAYRKGFIHRPVVQEWASFLENSLREHYPGWKKTIKAYRFQPTFDVDQAWAYRYKSPFLQLGGILRDALKADFKVLQLRRDVLAGKREDPFFTFADIETWHRKTDTDPIFFFHLGDYGAFDKNISYKTPIWRELIRRLDGAHQTGLHPSWKAGSDPAQLAHEIERYAQITGKYPVISRQHYLRLNFPQTYRMLLDHGIETDYSMGYADVPGFRAGISIPFPWYDLEREQTTPLMIFPFAVMDVTLKQYLKLKPADGLKVALALRERVKAQGGVFSTLWHNSSFSDIGGWRPWREIYLQLKKAAETTV